jgi:hypothetical protein
MFKTKEEWFAYFANMTKTQIITFVNSQITNKDDRRQFNDNISDKSMDDIIVLCTSVMLIVQKPPSKSKPPSIIPEAPKEPIISEMIQLPAFQELVLPEVPKNQTKVYDYEDKVIIDPKILEEPIQHRIVQEPIQVEKDPFPKRDGRYSMLNCNAEEPFKKGV